jgi:hypothetical protein
MPLKIEMHPYLCGGLFIGNTLSFSDTTLKLAQFEFDCLNFQRLSDLSKLMTLPEERRSYAGKWVTVFEKAAYRGG